MRGMVARCAHESVANADLSLAPPSAFTVCSCTACEVLPLTVCELLPPASVAQARLEAARSGLLALTDGSGPGCGSEDDVEAEMNNALNAVELSSVTRVRSRSFHSCVQPHRLRADWQNKRHQGHVSIVSPV